MIYVYCEDCLSYLEDYVGRPFDLTFLDPPFNLGKDYRHHNDKMPEDEYWSWMTQICRLIYKVSSKGAAIYFMQRDRNVGYVMNALEVTGWEFRNQIIWKKKASATPCKLSFGKHYQSIIYATKGRPRLFNKLRIDPPLLVTEKYERENGMFVTDVWDDIRELTSGYYAGYEPIRDDQGKRVHKQQTSIRLIARVILSSTKAGDLVFDPFAGTGTTLVAAGQLNRYAIGVEIDPINVDVIEHRLSEIRPSDDLSDLLDTYRYTDDLLQILYGYVSEEMISG